MAGGRLRGAGDGRKVSRPSSVSLASEKKWNNLKSLEKLKMFEGLVTESHAQNLALDVLFVPYSLDSTPSTLNPNLSCLTPASTPADAPTP